MNIITKANPHNRTGSHIMGKLVTSTLLATTMLIGSYSAQAMLPTPAPAMNDATNMASAQQNAIQTKTVAAVVSVDGQGRESLQAVDANTRLKRGDIIEYRSYLTNSRDERLRAMTVTMNIPKGVQLMGGVSPNNAFASVDGSHFGHMPLRGRINGTVQEVPLSYYQHLRWTIEGLDVGETAVVKYRVVVR